MKARRKGTNDLFQRVGITMLDGTTYSPEILEFEIEDIDKCSPEYWEEVRVKAAIAAMQGIMNFFGSIDYNRDTIAKLAVEQADALIKKLKGE